MLKGKICLIISAVLYGILPLLTTFAYRGGVNGITITFFRSSIAIPILLIVIGLKKKKLRINKNQFYKIIILSFFGGTLPVILLYLSYYYISTGLATTLHFIYPLITVLAIALLNHKRIKRDILASVLIVTVGIFMFTDISKSEDSVGVLLSILSGVFYSFYVVYLEFSKLDQMDYVVLTFYTMLVISVFIFIYGIFFHRINFNISNSSFFLSILISLIVTIGAMPLFQLGVRYSGASNAGIISALEPLTSVILGACFLDEHLGTSQMFGVAMILFGILLTQKKRLSVE